MSNINRIRKYFATMDAGEKQYMANKLFKEDKVVATQVKSYIPDSLLREELEFKVGDMVVVAHRLTGDSAFVQPGAFAKVSNVDVSVTVYPYLIVNGNGNQEWVKGNQIRKAD